MPHLMNCPHKAGSWCLDCVKKLGEENISLQNQRDSLAKGIRDAAVEDRVIVSAVVPNCTDASGRERTE